MIIQISAGQGPLECQLAVAKLYEALKKEYGDPQILSATEGQERGCFDSIRFQTAKDLRGLEGTVLWICRSSFRKNHKRKNWYVDVSVIPDMAGIPQEREYRIEKFRSGGKGGQNVNMVETEERSQYQNRQRAMERLQEKLAKLQKEQREEQVNAAWREHSRIVRGNPVRIYEGERFILRRSGAEHEDASGEPRP